MDISSVVGVILAFGLIIGSMMMGSAPMSAFIDLPSALVVIGGAMAACMTCFPLSNILSTPKIMLKVLLNKPADVKGVIEQLVSLAETARRDGLLALESRMDEVTNAYVKLGIQMAVDGTRPEIIEDIMRTEVDSVATRHQTGKALWINGDHYPWGDGDSVRRKPSCD
jgi:chemotaxis protein MotA